MARFRNSSPEQRFIPEATPQVVDPDSMFDVPDERASAFEVQPFFVPVPTAKKGDH